MDELLNLSEPCSPNLENRDVNILLTSRGWEETLDLVDVWALLTVAATLITAVTVY